MNAGEEASLKEKMILRRLGKLALSLRPVFAWPQQAADAVGCLVGQRVGGVGVDAGGTHRLARFGAGP